MQSITTIKKQYYWNIMLNRIYAYPFVVVLIVTFVALKCSSTPSGVDETNQLQEDRLRVNETKERNQTDTLIKKQKRNGLQWRGTIEVPASQITYVTLPMGGVVYEVYAKQGTYVGHGTLLALVGHPDYIHLQQQYLESKARLKFKRKEFRRQGQLTIEHASSIKKLQKAESEFLEEEATYIGLREKLKMIGIYPDSIRADHIHKNIQVFANNAGYVTRINTYRGKYVKPNDWMFQVTSLQRLQLVFEMEPAYLEKIKKGSNIWFHVAEKQEKYTATVSWLGKTLNHKQKIKIIADIQGNSYALIPGLEVQCWLQTGD